MKRKTTFIEKKLIENGFILTSKTYGGKHSEKTFLYVYSKELDDYDELVMLDKKRNKVLKYAISNVDLSLVDKETMVLLHHAFLDLKEFIGSLTMVEEPIPEELLESVE